MLLLFTCIDHENTDFTSLAQKLDMCDADKWQLSRYVRTEDKNRMIAGRYLLSKALESTRYQQFTIRDIKLDVFQKPGFGQKQYFNISHSDCLVACSFSCRFRVGVDVEKHQQLSFSDFSSVFTDRELSSIREAGESVTEFFRLWCRKEALIKGDGRGFYLTARDFDVLEDTAILENNIWHLRDVSLLNGYSACVANEGPKMDEVSIQEIFI
jgi:4'-phosphopantetheinyl transferase